MTTTDSRDRIIDAGLNLFFAGTFHGVGVTEICRSANVNKGTLYHYFDSKTQVLLGVLERYTDRVAADYEETAQIEMEPAERLRAFFRTAKGNSSRYHVANGFCPGCFIGNIATELSTSDPIVRSKVQWAMERLIAIFEPTIAELFARAGVRGDTAKAAVVFMGVLQGAQLMAKLHNDAALFDTFAATVVDTVLASADADERVERTDPPSHALAKS